MLNYLRKIIAGWCSVAVRDLTQEVASLRNQLSSTRKNRDEWQAECLGNATKLKAEVDLTDWQRSEITRLEGVCDSLRAEVSLIVDERNDFAADKVRLERELETLRQELSDERHEHAKTTKQLELAGAENQLLSTIHQVDVARREKDLAVEKRAKAEAESSIHSMLASAGEQE